MGGNNPYGEKWRIYNLPIQAFAAVWLRLSESLDILKFYIRICFRWKAYCVSNSDNLTVLQEF